MYAQLRNVIDLAVAAAFIQQQDYYGQAGWQDGDFRRREQARRSRPINTPLQVETVVASVWKGNQLMTPVGGGVTMQPRKALASENVLRDEEGKVSEARDGIKLGDLADGQWWWD